MLGNSQWGQLEWGQGEWASSGTSTSTATSQIIIYLNWDGNTNIPAMCGGFNG